MAWFETLIKPLLLAFGGLGLIALAAAGLFAVATKIRTTPFAWALAFALACGAAAATQYGASISLRMASGAMRLQPALVVTYAFVAFACILVSGYAKPSRWLIASVCVGVAAFALLLGDGAGTNASTLASLATAVVGIICWFLVPARPAAKGQGRRGNPSQA
jgi:hypothetical protein